ncbi:hypothetical protein ACFYXH_35825 [Streptomyces sp. NPDC002730]|uniref:hypothetical protein n=1 Tax=Streptomyces sp. NPDC002730 TaxID=3364662 RepID=UPI0036BAC486
MLGQIREEKKQADRVAKSLHQLWPVLVALSGSALSGVISSEVAAQRSFLGVFLATLAWSSGVALFVFLFEAKPLGDLGLPQHALIAIGCLLAGAAAAGWIGHGMYKADIRRGSYGETPWGLPLAPFEAAVLTFGWLGTALGAVCGTVAGTWAARLWKASQNG